MKKYFLIIFTLLLVLVLSVTVLFILNLDESLEREDKGEEPQKVETPAPQKEPVLREPLSNAKSRVTKKPFGIYITPQNSPVHPERFTGYHTGTDFETSPEEADTDIPVYAVCSGKVRQQSIVQGYGGVVIQDCVIENQPVTVLYGHLNLRQAQVLSVGADLKAGDRLSSLAPANSDLSGGERKHLHLGIHKGDSIELRGYVGQKDELANWLDPTKYL